MQEAEPRKNGHTTNDFGKGAGARAVREKPGAARLERSRQAKLADLPNPLEALATLDRSIEICRQQRKKLLVNDDSRHGGLQVILSALRAAAGAAEHAEKEDAASFVRRLKNPSLAGSLRGVWSTSCADTLRGTG